jgi:DNA-binding transcriptional LysR family regulator
MHICMDWRSIQFDWNQARAFLVTAEEGTLSAAARALGMTQPTLGRQVSALEQTLGTQLFDRIGTGLTLTPTGLELLAHVKQMGEAANALSLSAAGLSMTLEGNVCISATESMAYFTLPPLIAELRGLYPGIQIEIEVSNETRDLNRREADIALRAYRPTQPDLIVKRLKAYEARLYATPSYLNKLEKEHGKDAIQHGDFIGFSSTSDYPNQLKERLGLEIKTEQFPLLTMNHLVHWQLVKQGLGIGVMTTDVGDIEKQVVAVQPNEPTIKGELWLVTHSELRTNLRIRKVFDFLAERLGGV